jgi:2-amino-4-hydroxy-6-hydroxymethyldihydropteridine diphosphokinase
MARAYVGVGSNLDPEHNVRAAIRELSRAAYVVAVSTFYRTAPLGHPSDPWFINGVVAVETDEPGVALKCDVLRHIEDELGRRRGADRNAPRTIDLDLLYANGLPPDPDIRERAFVAWPLAEIAPEIEVDGHSIQAIAERLPREGMVPLPALTAALREEADLRAMPRRLHSEWQGVRRQQDRTAHRRGRRRRHHRGRSKP